MIQLDLKLRRSPAATAYGEIAKSLALTLTRRRVRSGSREAQAKLGQARYELEGFTHAMPHYLADRRVQPGDRALVNKALYRLVKVATVDPSWWSAAEALRHAVATGELALLDRLAGQSLTQADHAVVQYLAAFSASNQVQQRALAVALAKRPGWAEWAAPPVYSEALPAARAQAQVAPPPIPAALRAALPGLRAVRAREPGGRTELRPAVPIPLSPFELQVELRVAVRPQVDGPRVPVSAFAHIPWPSEDRSVQEPRDRAQDGAAPPAAPDRQPASRLPARPVAPRFALPNQPPVPQVEKFSEADLSGAQRAALEGAMASMPGDVAAQWAARRGASASRREALRLVHLVTPRGSVVLTNTQDKGSSGKFRVGIDPQLRALAFKEFRLPQDDGNKTHPTTAQELNEELAVMARLGLLSQPLEIFQHGGKIYVGTKLFAANAGAILPMLAGGGHHADRVALAWASLREVGAGLAELHAQGYVHNDIKPENIFVRDDGSFRLGDVGAAAAIDPRTGLVPFVGAGTRETMAPEILVPPDLDRTGRSAAARLRGTAPASDSWGLAVTALILLTGNDVFGTGWGVVGELAKYANSYATLVRDGDGRLDLGHLASRHDSIGLQLQPVLALGPEAAHFFIDRMLQPDPSRRASPAAIARAFETFAGADAMVTRARRAVTGALARGGMELARRTELSALRAYAAALAVPPASAPSSYLSLSPVRGRAGLDSPPISLGPTTPGTPDGEEQALSPWPALG